MQELNEAIAARAGVRTGGPYDRAIDAVRAAPEEEVPPLVEQLRRGVADLERVLGSAPSVNATEDTPDTVVRPRETEYDDWVRAELDARREEGSPGLSVL